MCWACGATGRESVFLISMVVRCPSPLSPQRRPAPAQKRRNPPWPTSSAASKSHTQPSALSRISPSSYDRNSPDLDDVFLEAMVKRVPTSSTPKALPTKCFGNVSPDSKLRLKRDAASDTQTRGQAGHKKGRRAKIPKSEDYFIGALVASAYGGADFTSKMMVSTFGNMSKTASH